jgi:hypothetical protein
MGAGGGNVSFKDDLHRSQQSVQDTINQQLVCLREKYVGKTCSKLLSLGKLCKPADIGEVYVIKDFSYSNGVFYVYVSLADGKYGTTRVQASLIGNL